MLMKGEAEGERGRVVWRKVKEEENQPVSHALQSTRVP